MKYYVKADLYW